MADELPPSRAELRRRQLASLRELLAAILPTNSFYAAKFTAASVPRNVLSLEEFSAQFPFTTKAELSADQHAHPPFGTDLTFPVERYTRCHQTSGTGGAPLRWLDTQESWEWLLSHWQRVYRAAGVTASDRVFCAFSFGPFLGFWMAFEAAARLGCLCLPGGGQSSATRLRQILDLRATVLCCTPTYALHLSEVAATERIDLRASAVQRILVAGEPGGSIPSVRNQIELTWPGASVSDHHGMTEMGPVTYQCPARPGVLHVMEDAYIAEVIDPATTATTARGHPGELVLTNLGRLGSPLLRYRTGDWMKALPEAVCACGSHELALEGGILGRVDDMLVVRGVNVFPSAVEEIVRAIPGVAEFRVRVGQAQALTELRLEVEPSPNCADAAALAVQIERDLAAALSLRVPVAVVPIGTLPRFELKAKRWVRS